MIKKNGQGRLTKKNGIMAFQVTIWYTDDFPINMMIFHGKVLNHQRVQDGASQVRLMVYKPH